MVVEGGGAERKKRELAGAAKRKLQVVCWLCCV